MKLVKLGHLVLTAILKSRFWSIDKQTNDHFFDTFSMFFELKHRIQDQEPGMVLRFVWIFSKNHRV